MTPREAIEATTQWALTFWTTLTTESALDWPISYFVILGVAGLVALYTTIIVLVVIAESIKSTTKR